MTNPRPSSSLTDLKAYAFIGRNAELFRAYVESGAFENDILRGSGKGEPMGILGNRSAVAGGTAVTHSKKRHRRRKGA